MKRPEIQVIEANQPELSDFDWYMLSKWFAKQALAYYKDPANKEKYYRYKAEKEKEGLLNLGGTTTPLNQAKVPN